MRGMEQVRGQEELSHCGRDWTKGERLGVQDSGGKHCDQVDSGCLSP